MTDLVWPDVPRPDRGVPRLVQDGLGVEGDLFDDGDTSVVAAGFWSVLVAERAEPLHELSTGCVRVAGTTRGLPPEVVEINFPELSVITPGGLLLDLTAVGGPVELEVGPVRTEDVDRGHDQQGTPAPDAKEPPELQLDGGPSQAVRAHLFPKHHHRERDGVTLRKLQDTLDTRNHRVYLLVIFPKAERSETEAITLN